MADCRTPWEDRRPARLASRSASPPSTLTYTRAERRSGLVSTEVTVTNPIRGSSSSLVIADPITSRMSSLTLLMRWAIGGDSSARGPGTLVVLTRECRPRSGGLDRTPTRLDNAIRRSAPGRLHGARRRRRPPTRTRACSVARCRARPPRPPRRRSAVEAVLSASAGAFACPSSRGSRSGAGEPPPRRRRWSPTQDRPSRRSERPAIRAQPPASPGPGELFERLLDLPSLEELEEVAHLHVLIALEHDPTLQALVDLLDVVLEPPERADAAGPHDGAVANQAHLGGPGDLAVGHQAAGDRADA